MPRLCLKNSVWVLNLLNFFANVSVAGRKGSCKARSGAADRRKAQKIQFKKTPNSKIPALTAGKAQGNSRGSGFSDFSSL